MDELRLEIRDFVDIGGWRWVLTNAGGEFLADHEVRLDRTSWQYEAFTDLDGYLRWHVAPDRWIEQEAAIVGQVGTWVGQNVLGRVGPALVKWRPATVRVLVPREASQLMFLPLELGHVGGKPLAVQGVTLAMECVTEDAVGRSTAPVGDRLRVLGLFSLPTGGRALNLRKERCAFVETFQQIGSVDRAVDVRVLQYGVTRQRLRDVLEEGEGWDLIHVSGHGSPGELLLEAEDGSPDPVTADELVDMLDLARERVKLVTVSACWSAAPMLAEQRRLLQLPAQDASRTGHEEPPRAGNSTPGQRQTAALASTLAEQLACAVLAMRYPVTDDFAIRLTTKLYDLLAGKGRPLAQALGIALKDPEVIATPPTAGCPALSIATPALFGAQAVDLRLHAPERTVPASYGTTGMKLAQFPPQPDLFVGRTAVMASASAALAPRSGVSGVLLYGMPGGGKTACALELAYTHEDQFERLVWFKAPDEGLDIADALPRFGLALETGLPGLRVVHLLNDAARLASFLPSLTELCERRRVLIVLDNIESLLTESGRWRDERWRNVVTALCGHAGLGRVMLTSRRRPEILNSRVHTALVDALSLDEALLLTRDLRHLGALVGGEFPGLDPDVARGLAVSVLEVAQGHPKLLELADAQAAKPQQLREVIKAVSSAWQDGGGLSEALFSTGEAQASADDYLRVLAAWTRAAAAGLPQSTRELFGFLSCLEEADRTRGLVDRTWPVIWAHRRQTQTLPRLSEDLAILKESCLISAYPATGDESESFKIHPGVAAEGRAVAGEALCTTTDAVLASFWSGIAQQMKEGVNQSGSTQWLVTAGMRAAHYLFRQGEYAPAGMFLDAVLERDSSREVVATVLPMLQVVTAATSGTAEGSSSARTLARAQQMASPVEAEHRFHTLLTEALNRQDFRAASGFMRDLARGYFQAGQLGEALRAAEKALEFAKKAGLGPWTELSIETQRLQAQVRMGQGESVLAEVRQMLNRVKTLPEPIEELDPAHQWNVYEVLNSVGFFAAINLALWQAALDFTQAVIKSKRDRRAPGISIAQTRFNSWEPLVRLGYLDEARTLVTECREVFEQDGDIRLIGTALVALASIEGARGHGSAATDLAKDGLRYLYITGDAKQIASCHHALAELLLHASGHPADAIPHRFAAALIHLASGGTVSESFAHAVAYDLRVSDHTATLPSDLTELCDEIAGVPGADLMGLLNKLVSDRDIIEQALSDLVDCVRSFDVSPPNWAPFLAMFDPAIAALVAADRGETQAGVAFDYYYLRDTSRANWAELIRVFRLIRSGERGPELADGLAPAHAAIARRALDALANRVAIPTELWQAIPLGNLLFALVASKLGDSESARQAREDLTSLSEDPRRGKLVQALEQILAGDHGPALIHELTDPIERAIVTTVITHMPNEA